MSFLSCFVIDYMSEQFSKSNAAVFKMNFLLTCHNIKKLRGWVIVPDFVLIKALHY